MTYNFVMQRKKWVWGSAIVLLVSLYFLGRNGGLFEDEVMARGFPHDRPQEINCGDTLGPGGHYKLANDLRCSCDTTNLDENGNVKPALTIIGPINVDLNGKGIACEPCTADQCKELSEYSITGIQMKGKRAKVRNGNIIRCNVGVVVGEDVEPAEEGHHQIRNVRVVASQEVIFFDDGECDNFKGDGMVLESTHNVVSRNELWGNQNDGIDPKAGYNLIKRNLSIGNGGRGYNIDFDHNRVIRNQALLNDNDGIEVDNGVGTEVIRNQTIRNGRSGIEIRDEALNTTIKFNKALFNGRSDLEDDNPKCDDNLWKRNTFNSKNPEDANCIH